MGMEEAGRKIWITGAKLVMATDDMVVKRALCKGNSKSLELFNLVLRFKILEILYECTILVTHVAGSRMIQQGTDRISRGDMSSGVSVGKSMLKHCPWKKSAMMAEPKIIDELNINSKLFYDLDVKPVRGTDTCFTICKK